MGGEEGGGAVEACSRAGAVEWEMGAADLEMGAAGWEMGAAEVKCCTSIRITGEVDLVCPSPRVEALVI